MSRLRNLLSLPLRKAKIAPTPSEVVHHENKWSLLRYKAGPQGGKYKRPIVMVPSLINRHYVLDLAPEKSMVAYLVEQGHDVYIIDWGKPGREDKFLTLDDIADRYIGRATRVAARLSGVSKVHLLGYCMGGIFTTMHIARRPERIASHVAIAAPLSFDNGGILSTWTRSPKFDVNALVDAFGNVPARLLQASFHMLKPTLGLWKRANVVDRAANDEFLDGFVATEHWGKDNIDFPGEVFRALIEDLYRNDGIMQETICLGGEPVRLGNIETPTLIVTFEHDYIVPKESAMVMLDKISSEDQEHIHLNGGHVGAVVSRKAATGLWPQLSQWWIQHETEDQVRALENSRTETTVLGGSA
ncbi:MAG: alpha/beta fold hydrolase [Kofleriaceae bacterium]|nr:alpha/beta fold hydrolase [Kofleriaceae bacterium]